MNHNWIDVPFHIPGINKQHCESCKADVYVSSYEHHVKVRYLWLKPMGDIQPVCPETCEDTIEMIGFAQWCKNAT
jgi:hypothetical protein